MSSGLLQAVQNICQTHPNIRLVLCNSAQQDLNNLGLPDSQVIRYPALLFEEWANVLPRLDIGLVPLQGDYDLRTSSISLLEFMLSKIPWIATDIASLRQFSSYGLLTQNISADWEQAITGTVDQLVARRKKAAGDAFLYALSQDVNGNIDKVLKLYTNILNQV